MKVKPETEIRNLKREVKELRLLCEGAGVPLLLIYIPRIAIKNLDSKEPRKLTKEQLDWIKKRMKEFNKLLKTDQQ